MEKIERVKPIELVDPSTNETLTLEFNRASVQYAERNGFDVSAFAEGKVMTGVSDLFFYAFRMHHPRYTRQQTDKLLFDELGGLPQSAIDRLMELYALPYETLIREDDNAKNSRWEIRL